MSALSTLLAAIPAPVLNRISRHLARMPFLRRALSERLIDKYANALPVRPRPVSMAADYPAWNGLTDRRFSGRHLGRADHTNSPKHPPIDQLLPLFRREAFRPASDTSILFAFFAQWFTDGFLRTKWEPPEGRRHFRMNESNHEIDLCQIYGISEVQTAMLREPAPDSKGRGRLRSQMIDGGEWPDQLYRLVDEKVELRPEFAPGFASDGTEVRAGLYTSANLARVVAKIPDHARLLMMAVGLEHGNATAGHVLMNTIFLREHNRNAGIIADAHPDWDDERVFQTARNTTITVLLNIVIEDYIVHIAPVAFPLVIVPGVAERKPWYRTNWIPVEFALLYRWHDLIPDAIDVRGDRIEAMRFRGATVWIRAKGMDAVLEAATRQPAGRIGMGNTHSWLVADDPKGPNVKKMSIEMARECGLRGFNAYRHLCGLKPYPDFESLTKDPALAERLRALYGEVDRLEWFVGLFAEGYGDPDMMGEVMTTMVASDAFTQALTNPLLAGSVYGEEAFSKAGLAVVRSTNRLAQVIARNSGVASWEGDSFLIRT